MGSLGELEKGESGLVGEQSRLAKIVKGRALERAIYSTIIVLLTTLVFLLRYRVVSPTKCVVPRSEPAAVAGIPAYALDYAPLVWLDTDEKYFPSDIFAQVENTTPSIDAMAIDGVPSPLTLDNLDALNAFGDGGSNVYLTSIVDVTTNPAWLEGVAPDDTGKTGDAITAAIIVNDRGAGAVDVFYMYFFAYNQGNVVLGQELGDHVGDWEHNMIRFQDGAPQQIWYSQHGNGQAFTYDVVEKSDVRPIAYAARGSHAVYAIAGTHDHTIPDVNLPGGLLEDYTSQGRLWDPTLSSYFYTYAAADGSFAPADDAGASPLGALNYKGKWGDAQYADDDDRQRKFFGFYKFTGGPTGPADKQLNRTDTCPDNGILCIIRDILGP